MKANRKLNSIPGDDGFSSLNRTRTSRVVKLLVTLLVVFVSPISVYGAQTCSRLFTQEEGPSSHSAVDFREIISSLAKEHLRTRVFETESLSDYDATVAEVYIRAIIRTSHALGHHFLTVNTVTQRPATSKSPSSQTASIARKAFDDAGARALEFVLRQYGERREHWPPSFIEKLRKLAHDYRDFSTYINVETNESGKGGGLDASIRFIREKNGLLPMEDYLGVKLKLSEQYLKVEPGNFAMEKKANEIASIELSIGMLAEVARLRKEYGREPFMVTYADAYSEPLYGRMGYRYVTTDMIDLETVRRAGISYVVDAKSGAVRLSKDGVVWAPMYATSPMLTHILEKRIASTAVKVGGETMAEALFGLKNAFSATMDSVNRVYLGKLASNSPELHGKLASVSIEKIGNRMIVTIFGPGNEWESGHTEMFSLPWDMHDGYFSSQEHSSRTQEVSLRDGKATVVQHVEIRKPINGEFEFQNYKIQTEVQFDPVQRKLLWLRQKTMTTDQIVSEFILTF